MFCHTTQDLRRLPPTRDALLHHCKRMIYQGGIWTQTHDAQVVLPSREEYGWQKEACGSWSPLWITLETSNSKCYKETCQMRMQESVHFMLENGDAVYLLVQMSVFT